MDAVALRMTPDHDPARLASCEDAKLFMGGIGAVFAVIAVVGWVLRGSLLRKIKRQSEAHVS